MSKKTNETEVRFSITGADDSRQEVERVRKAVEDFSDEGKKAAQPVTSALQNIQREFDKLEQKETDGKKVTERELGVMVQQFELLRRTIIASFGSLEAAPKELQVAFQKAEGQISEATDKVRTATAAVKNHSSEVAEAGARWGGFKDAIKDAFPALSSFIAKAGEIAGAFGAGLAIGQQLNTFLKTDMSEWGALMEQISTRANAMIRAASDSLVAIGVVIKDIVTFNIKDLSRDTDILKSTITQSFTTMKEALTDTGNEWLAYAPKVGVATEASKAAAEAAIKLAEEKKKLADELNKVVRSLQAENAELAKQKILAEDASIGMVNSSSDLGYYKRNLDAATAALAEQSAKVQELSQRYGENDPAVTQARDKQRQLEDQVRSSQTQYENTKTEVAKYEEQHKSATQAIAKGEEAVKTLNKEVTDQQKKITAVTKATGETSTATEKHESVIKQVTPTIIMYKDEHGKLHIETKKVGDATKETAANIQKIGESATKAANPVKGMTDAMDAEKFNASAAAVKGLTNALNEFTPAAEKAAAAASKVEAATAKAAGSSGGGGGGGFSDSDGGGTLFNQFPGGA